MNKKREQLITNAISEIESVKGKVNGIMADEIVYFNKIPENLQGGYKLVSSESAIKEME